MPCSGWLFSRSESQSVCAPSGGRPGARQHSGVHIFARRKLEDVQAQYASLFGPELPIRCFASSTTFGFLLNRRPGLPRAASGRFLGRPVGLGTRTCSITSVKKTDSWRCPAVRRAAIGSPLPSVTRCILVENPPRPYPRAGLTPSSSRLVRSPFCCRSAHRPPSGWPESLCCVHPTAPSRPDPRRRVLPGASGQPTAKYHLRPNA